MPFDTIMAGLPKLSPAELVEVRTRVNALSSLAGIDTADDWLLQGIIYVLGERGLGETVPNMFRISNRRQYRGYLPKSEKVRATFESQYHLNRVSKVALGRVLARSLAEYIEKFRAVSLASLLQSAELALPAFDAAFPGYLQGGHVMVVLRGFSRAVKGLSPRVAG